MKFASLSAVLRNRISLLGSAVVQVTLILLVTLVAIELLGAEGHFDCRPCHMIVAWNEASPEILELLKR